MPEPHLRCIALASGGLTPENRPDDRCHLACKRNLCSQN
jgi:hypothetical protein